MKISKTFRLSEEAVEILNKQENQAQYLENLILSKTNPAPSNSMLESIREIIKEELKAHSPQVANSSPPSPQKIEPVYSSVPNPNKDNIGDILAEINRLDKELWMEIEFSQDPDFIEQMKKDYNALKQPLWDRYHQLKGDQ